MSAVEVIAHIREHGGRVFRYLEPPKVFALTTDAELATWLMERKGRPHVPVGMGVDHEGSYLRAKGGTREWDYWLTPIPVKDPPRNDDEPWNRDAIWEAAA
jgi:hypothetical protein